MFLHLGSSLKGLGLCGEMRCAISNVINMDVLTVCWDFFVCVGAFFFPFICSLLDNLGIHWSYFMPLNRLLNLAWFFCVIFGDVHFLGFVLVCLRWGFWDFCLQDWLSGFKFLWGQRWCDVSELTQCHEEENETWNF